MIAKKNIGFDVLWMLAVVALLCVPVVIHYIRNGSIIVERSVDTDTYAIGAVSVENLLQGIRTPIYPLLVVLCGGLQNSYVILSLQFAIYAAILFAIFNILVELGASRWLSLLSIVPFSTGSIFLAYANRLLPEILAAGFSFLALFLMMARWPAGGTTRRECLLGFFVFSAVLTKPQYLFLVPVSLWTLVVILMRGNSLGRADVYRKLVVGAGATLGPLFTYATVRWIVAGHFGLVSFGGANLAGIALNPLLFDAKFVENLEEGEVRDAATAVLSLRQRLLKQGEEQPEMKLRESGALPAIVLDAAHLRSLSQYEAVSVAYNANVWDVGRPALIQLYQSSSGSEGSLNVRVDRMLSRISTAVLRDRFAFYLAWLGHASVEGINRLVRYDGINSRLLTIVLTVVGFAGFASMCVGFWKISAVARGRLILLTASVAIACIPFGGKVLGLILGIWGWLPGSVTPLLLPTVTVVAGVLLSLAMVIPSDLVRNATRHTGWIEYAISCCGCYVCAGMLLVVAVELPLDRYLMTLAPPLVVSELLVMYHVLQRFIRKMMGPNEG